MSDEMVKVVGVTDTMGEPVLSRTTLEMIAKRRQAAGRLVAGLAATASSDDFKDASVVKPLAKRWDHMISRESKSRQPSILKATAKYLQKPNLISLGGGLPHPDYFPIEGLILQAPMPPDFSNDTQGSSGSQVSMTKHDVARDDDVYDLSIALTYGLGTGSAQLLRFVTEHTEMTSNPPYADWQCCLTVGTTSATEQAYRMLCERGDYILAEEFTYPTAIETAVALGLKVVGITVDNEGLCPERMDEILSNWDAQARGARKPHLLYTIPSGANPTGATQSTARRKAIYAIAQKHDIYILEDEPYYFLQMQPYAGQEQRDIPTPASIPAFLDTLVATYLSLDVDGRVLRMDSFSKIICPGSRTGWITASAQIIERFIRHNECSNQNPSGFSQIILYKLLDATWGHQGYLHWLMKLGKEYTRRRNVILAACENHLPKVVTWNPPAAGMFLWLEIDWKSHPAASTRSLAEVEEDIFQACIARDTLFCKGSWFAAEGSAYATDRMFFRASFASATVDDMTTAMGRFGDAVRASFGLASPEHLSANGA